MQHEVFVIGTEIVLGGAVSWALLQIFRLKAEVAGLKATQISKLDMIKQLCSKIERQQLDITDIKLGIVEIQTTLKHLKKRTARDTQ